jgi:hypothetical protein
MAAVNKIHYENDLQTDPEASQRSKAYKTSDVGDWLVANL